MKLRTRVVNHVIWYLYLAGMGLSAYGTFAAWVMDKPGYVVAGIIGWVASTVWGLFFRIYVMEKPGKGKRRKSRTGVGGEIKWHPVWGWHLESFRRGRDI